LAETLAVFAAASAFLLALAPSAPFTRELGVCESGAVRDVLAGNIILPRFIPGPMVHVPPLYWWTAALGVHAFGWSEIALRMPSMVAAALTCAIVFMWASIALNRRLAWWSASSLLLNHFFLDAARQPRMDSMLALFVTAAAMAFERALRASGDNSSTPMAVRSSTDESFAPIDPRSQRIALTLAAVMIGAGILTKGILGILLPGLVVGLYLVVRRRFRDLFRVDLIVTFVVGLMIGLSWYFAAYQIGGQKFLQWQLAMNLWSRFIPAEAGGAGYCAHPFWYFTPQTITGFIPWSVYLLAVAIHVWPRRGRKLPDASVFTLCWFAAIFVFFSTSHGKCLVYILPAFPPLAVLTGIAIDAAATREPHGIAMSGSASRGQEPPSREAQDRAFMALFAVATGVVAAAAIAIALAAVAAIIFGVPPGLLPRLHPTDRRFVEIFSSLAARRASVLLALIAACISGGVMAMIGLRQRYAQLQASSVLIVAAAGSWFWFAVMNPALEERETLREFAHEVARTVPIGNAVAHLGLSDCDLNFYSPEPLTPIYHLRCDGGAAAFNYIVARKIDFDASPVTNRACFKPILESPSVDSQGPRVLFERVPTH
jgi:4-amino-4-deoxy-L-arabinose transferase-like glycosyltransferase